MSDLIAIAYPDPFRAAEVMATLGRLQMEHLIDLEDACYVTHDPSGKVKLHQSVDLTTAGAVSGAFWGTLVGMLFLNPLFGLAVGAASGALGGLATDIGINDDFMRSLGAQLQPGSSAIFILIRQYTPDRVIAEISKFGGTILRTSLTADAEAKLKEAFAQAQASAGVGGAAGIGIGTTTLPGDAARAAAEAELTSPAAAPASTPSPEPPTG